MLLRTAHVTKKFFGSHSNKNAHFFAFAIYDAANTATKAFFQAVRALGIKQFYIHGRHN